MHLCKVPDFGARQEGRRDFTGDFGGGVWGDGPEDDDRSGEARVAEADALVRGELGHGLAPDQVLPVVLSTEIGISKNGNCFQKQILANELKMMNLPVVSTLAK